jgi:hypothetical protein
MSTAVAVPAHIAARIAARKSEGTTSSTMTAVVSGDGFPFPRVSIRAGRYRLVDEGVETVVGVSMDVVIVGVNPSVSKIFYGKPFDPSATDMRPDCFSHDGLKPDSSVTTPVSTSCATCPNNVLGSKVTPTGAKSKLCADQRHLAVVPAGDPSKIYALTVPVSGMKALREYFKELQNYNMIVEEVVTELSFDESVSYPKITFKRKGFVGEKALPTIDKIVQGEEVKEVTRVIPIGTVTKAAALAAPVAAAAAVAAVEAPKVVKAAKPAPAPAPVEVVEEAYEEEAPAAAVTDLEKALDSMFE